MGLLNKLKEFFTESKINELEKKVNKIVENQEVSSDFKIISNSYFNGGNNRLTIIFKDGEVLEGIINPDDYHTILLSNSKAYIQNYFLNNVKKDNDIEESFIKEISAKTVSILENTSDFTIIDNEVYLNNFKSVPVPKLLVAEFIRLVNLMYSDNGEDYYEYLDEYNALVMFTYKLCANPVEESRETLLNFIKNNNVDLTTSGNMILFRNIVSKGRRNKEYTNFISKEYFRIKKMKKSPKNYSIYDDNGLVCLHMDKVGYNNYLGNLYDLYNNLDQAQDNSYTDAHTKTYDIKINSLYKIREEDIELNKNGSCGGLLHVAAKEGFNYSSFGDTRVCALVNPMVVARTDTGYSAKIGVKEMWIACILDENEQVPNLIHFDNEYDKHTINELNEIIENRCLNSISIAEEYSELNLKEVMELKEVLENRIIFID